jgi:putative phosphoesterase
MTRIAVLADVHGNLPALEAAIEDIGQRRVDLVLNLGDHASGPLWPRETVALLMQHDWTCIAGNCDRQIAREAPSAQTPSDRFALERLTPSQVQWLAELPPTTTAHDGDVLLCHGTPSTDSAYLLETVEHGHVRLATPREVQQRLGGVAAPVVLCGHSHVPRIVRAGTTLLVNPGSIGLPAYEQDEPEPHVMESGSPDAHYAIIDHADGGWRAELIALPYDHRRAAEQARRNGRHDWEISVRTGYARG